MYSTFRVPLYFTPLTRLYLNPLQYIPTSLLQQNTNNKQIQNFKK